MKRASPGLSLRPATLARRVIPWLLSAALVALTGRPVFADPVPDPFQQEAAGTLLAKFPVSASNPFGEDQILDAGDYRFEAFGTYSYGGTPDGPLTADAECSRFLVDPTWQRHRFGGPLPNDPLDLYVNGPVEWTAVTPDPFTCNGADNRYKLPFSTSRQQAVNFFIFDNGAYGDNAGGLTVEIYQLPPQPVEQLIGVVTAPAAHFGQSLPSPPLVSRQTYRLEVAGTYTYNGLDRQADAECSSDPFNPLNPGPVPNRYADLDPSGDVLDLYVDDLEVNAVADGPVVWDPVFKAKDGDACASDPGHTYQHVFSAQHHGPVFFRINDPAFGDNMGALTVKVFLRRAALPDPTGPAPDGGSLPVPETPPVTALPEPPADAAFVPIGLQVPADGTSVSVALGAGPYKLEASGTYVYGGGSWADAECSTFFIDSTWQRYRLGGPVPSDPLDLSVNDGPVEWMPVGQSSVLNCKTEAPALNDPSIHRYKLFFNQPPPPCPEGTSPCPTTGPVSFKIVDSSPGDNAGALTVTITKLMSPVFQEQLIALVPVDSSWPAGVVGVFAPPVVAGRTYRLEVTGTYRYAGPDQDADAECSDDPTNKANPGFTDQRWAAMEPSGDLLDLYVDDRMANGVADGPVVWTPVLNAGACATDANHTYQHTFTAVDDAALRLFVHELDPNEHFNNQGQLLVRVFLRT